MSETRHRAEIGDGARTGPGFAWYGDDFTGATDTLATLTDGGQRAMLFLDAPTPEQLARAGRLDAIGIAGASRTMDPRTMARSLEPVGQFFAQSGARILHYKCCSTFDSAPEIGNIAVAVQVLRRFFRNPFVPIVGGQPSLGRYCVFSNLFAAAGIGGEVFRIDRHPTMAAHPVTPMGEADLRRHFATLGLRKVAALHWTAYELAAAELEALLEQHLAEQPDAVLLDVAHHSHLTQVARLICKHAKRQPLLAVGASSVAQALVPQWKQAPPQLAAPSGQVFIVVGSLSPVTRRQLAAASSFEHVSADAARLADDRSYAAALQADVVARLRAGRHVILATSMPQDRGALAGHARVAAATAQLTAEVTRQSGVRRVGIAGGDTSTQAVKALAPWALTHETTLAAGVALCRVHSDDPALHGLELMLKGGQMGPPDLFEQLAHGSPG